MLLPRFISDAAAALQSLYPEAEARNIAVLLCSHFLGTKSYTHITEPQTIIPENRLEQLQGALDRLLAAEPLQYVTGTAPFYGYDFHVTPAVLIPRPETEILVDTAVAQANAASRCAEKLRAIDVCTGSGCIAWSLALSCPQVEVSAVDISPEALEVASSQPLGKNLPHGSIGPQFHRLDLLEAPPAEFASGFDIFLSNPPYIMDKEKVAMRDNVLKFEPSLALFVPDSDPLLFYRALTVWGQALMKPGAFGMVEINEQLGEETRVLFEHAGFVNCRIVKDFFNKDRFVTFEKQR